MNAWVIVPTHERPAELRRCLDALLPQAQSVCVKVCVVDDGTPGGSKDAARGADRYVWQPDLGYRLATARNVGARLALTEGAEALVFLDGDLVPQGGWLSAMVNVLSQDGQVVYGTVNGRSSDPVKLRAQGRLWLTARGGNMAVSRAAWERVGPFDEAYNGGWGVEDTDWLLRAIDAGIEPLFCRADVVHPAHDPRPGWREEQVANWAKLVAKHPGRDLGPRPEPVRTDDGADTGQIPAMSGMDTGVVRHGDLSGVWIVTPTRGRPGEYERWKVERLTWGCEVAVCDDNAALDRELLAVSGAKCLRSGEGNVTKATRVTVERAIQGDAEIIVELDDHDWLGRGREDVLALVAAIRAGADYAYGDHVKLREGSENPCPAPEHEPGMLLNSGMRWQGCRAYSVAAYQAVGGYRDDEVPAGEYALVLRMELRGMRLVRVPGVVTHCPQPDGAVTRRLRGAAGMNIRRWVDLARKGEWDLGPGR